jgi:general secretion pathway protein G
VYIEYVNRAKNTICVNDIRNIQREIELFEEANGRLPYCLDEFPGGNRVDPWGISYQYLNYDATEKEKGGGGGGMEKQRKDRFMRPLNTNYDLYSMGADGKSAAPLTAKQSRDDIVRAQDGEYIVIAANF